MESEEKHPAMKVTWQCPGCEKMITEDDMLLYGDGTCGDKKCEILAAQEKAMRQEAIERKLHELEQKKIRKALRLKGEVEDKVKAGLTSACAQERNPFDISSMSKSQKKRHKRKLVKMAKSSIVPEPPQTPASAFQFPENPVPAGNITFSSLPRPTTLNPALSNPFKAPSPPSPNTPVKTETDDDVLTPYIPQPLYMAENRPTARKPNTRYQRAGSWQGQSGFLDPNPVIEIRPQDPNAPTPTEGLNLDHAPDLITEENFFEVVAPPPKPTRGRDSRPKSGKQRASVSLPKVSFPKGYFDIARTNTPLGKKPGALTPDDPGPARYPMLWEENYLKDSPAVSAALDNVDSLKPVEEESENTVEMGRKPSPERPELVGESKESPRTQSTVADIPPAVSPFVVPTLADIDLLLNQESNSGGITSLPASRAGPSSPEPDPRPVTTSTGNPTPRTNKFGPRFKRALKRGASSRSYTNPNPGDTGNPTPRTDKIGPRFREALVKGASSRSYTAPTPGSAGNPTPHTARPEQPAGYQDKPPASLVGTFPAPEQQAVQKPVVRYHLMTREPRGPHTDSSPPNLPSNVGGSGWDPDTFRSLVESFDGTAQEGIFAKTEMIAIGYVDKAAYKKPAQKLYFDTAREAVSLVAAINSCDRDYRRFMLTLKGKIEKFHRTQVGGIRNYYDNIIKPRDQHGRPRSDCGRSDTIRIALEQERARTLGALKARYDKVARSPDAESPGDFGVIDQLLIDKSTFGPPDLVLILRALSYLCFLMANVELR